MQARYILPLFFVSFRRFSLVLLLCVMCIWWTSIFFCSSQPFDLYGRISFWPINGELNWKFREEISWRKRFRLELSAILNIQSCTHAFYVKWFEPSISIQFHSLILFFFHKKILNYILTLDKIFGCNSGTHAQFLLRTSALFLLGSENWVTIISAIFRRLVHVVCGCICMSLCRMWYLLWILYWFWFGNRLHKVHMFVCVSSSHSISIICCTSVMYSNDPSTMPPSVCILHTILWSLENLLPRRP